MCVCVLTLYIQKKIKKYGTVYYACNAGSSGNGGDEPAGEGADQEKKVTVSVNNDTGDDPSLLGGVVGESDSFGVTSDARSKL